MARPRGKLQRRTLAKAEKIIRFELLGKTTKEIAQLTDRARYWRRPPGCDWRAPEFHAFYGA